MKLHAKWFCIMPQYRCGPFVFIILKQACICYLRACYFFYFGWFVQNGTISFASVPQEVRTASSHHPVCAGEFMTVSTHSWIKGQIFPAEEACTCVFLSTYPSCFPTVAAGHSPAPAPLLDCFWCRMLCSVFQSLWCLGKTEITGLKPRFLFIQP